MAQIYNSDLTKNLIEQARIATSVDKVPDQIAEKVVPILDVTPAFHRKLNYIVGGSFDATTATIMTTHATKRTFLVGVAMSLSKDVVSTSTFSQVNITPFGMQQSAFAVLRYEPVTAGNLAQTIMLPMPIELAKGSIIQSQNNTAVASIDFSVGVYYYEVDP